MCMAAMPGCALLKCFSTIKRRHCWGFHICFFLVFLIFLIFAATAGN